MVDLSIIVVSWNTGDLLAQCLQCVYDTAGSLGLEVIVADNASADGSVDLVRRHFPRAQIIVNAENVGFVRANNQAIERCQGRYVLLLNSDALVLPGSLVETVCFLDDHPRAGIAGVRLLNADGTFQASYTPFPTLWREFLILSGLGRWLVRPNFPSCGPAVEGGPQKIAGYMEGAYLMARREAVEQVGGLDGRIFMYAEDVDWCYRFHRAGWEVWYLPQISVVHLGGQSSKQRRGRMEAELYRSRVYLFRKHYGRAAACALRCLVCAICLPKMLFHRLLRFLTRGRRGRTVTSWRDLRAALWTADAALEGR